MVLHQRKYVKGILKRFRMYDSTPTSLSVEANLKLEKHGEEDIVDTTLFKQIVGSMIYVCNSQSNIDFSVKLVSRHMSEPNVSHMNVARRILKYLKESTNYRILFRRDSERKEDMVTCYSDANWCGIRKI
jgi:hypothetical protein